MFIFRLVAFDEDSYINGDISNYKINTEDAKTGGQSYALC